MTSKFGEDLKQSEDAMASQFDPNDPSYHGGLQTPVPIGGGKVPEGMSEGPPEGYTPPPKIEYGAEYDKAMADRTKIQSFKQKLNGIPTKAATIAAKPDKAQYQKDLSDLLDDLGGYYELYPKDTEYGRALTVIIANYRKVDEVKKTSNASLLKDGVTKLVREMQLELKVNLAEIKKLKKEGLARHKAAQASA